MEDFKLDIQRLYTKSQYAKQVLKKKRLADTNINRDIKSGKLEVKEFNLYAIDSEGRKFVVVENQPLIVIREESF